MKTRYYNMVMSVVTDLTDLTEQQILYGKRTREVVDARWLCVRLMSELGMYTRQIAGFMRMSMRAVQYILMDFDARIKFGDAMLNIYLFQARKRVEVLRNENEGEAQNKGSPDEVYS